MVCLHLHSPILRSTGLGEELATQLTNILNSGESVRIDCAKVEMMTPSFANTVLMNLLERFSMSDLRARCQFVNRCDVVVETMNCAVQRYEHGIRLSTQRCAVA